MIQNFGLYTDFELIKLINGKKPGSDRAFNELYDRYESRIYKYCYYMLGDRDSAEDIFQETFIKFYSALQRDINSSNIGGYLFITARNFCLNFIKKKKMAANIPTQPLEYRERFTYENKELFDLIVAATELLDLKYKEAFVLREFDGLSFNEIAGITDTSVSNAKSRVVRAKEKIIKILEPYVKELNL